jgi:poly-gamma-glutamate synthesis protein (capsule biosynthesis protein)
MKKTHAGAIKQVMPIARIALVAVFALLFLGATVEARAATTVRDGFTLAAVGDIIIVRPISNTRDPAFGAMASVLREADAAVGNFEGSAFDMRRFRGHPQAQFGGVLVNGSPQVAADLRSLGIGLVSRANNHALDWGVEGMRLTTETLAAAGIVSAGAGEHRAAARAAGAVNTPKGRIALVSAASSYTKLSRAAPPVGAAPGRPGVSALRTTRYALVTREEARVLRRIRDEQPGASALLEDDPDQFELFGDDYRVADRRGFEYEMHPVDRDEILESVRAAKRDADFVLLAVHAHQPGNWSEDPPDFFPRLARAAIDAGADQVVGHGPHRLRGVEIYKGKPIFYGLGNFVFQLDLLESASMDLYERFGLDPSRVSGAEFHRMWAERQFGNDVWYRSVVAVSRFAGGNVVEILLYPIDLDRAGRHGPRGVPRLAAPAVARTVLEDLRRLSRPFGTTLVIDGDVGRIGVPGPEGELSSGGTRRTWDAIGEVAQAAITFVWPGRLRAFASV